MICATEAGEPIDAAPIGRPKRDPATLRRLLILKMYAAGESPVVIADVFRCSCRHVYRELASIDPEVGSRALN